MVLLLYITAIGHWVATARLQEKRDRWKHSPPLYGTCMVADVQKHRFGRTSAQVLGTKGTLPWGGANRPPYQLERSFLQRATVLLQRN